MDIAFSKVLVRVAKDASFTFVKYAPFPKEILDVIAKVPKSVFGQEPLKSESELSSRLWISVARTSRIVNTDRIDKFVIAETLAAFLVCVFDVYSSLVSPKAQTYQDQFARAINLAEFLLEDKQAADFFRVKAAELAFFPSVGGKCLI